MNLDLMSLEGAAAYYRELESKELATDEHIRLARWLSELVEARKKIKELELINKGKMSVEDAIDETTLTDWYISSVGSEEPVWTDAHIEELFNDFYLFPKTNNLVEYSENDINQRKFNFCEDLLFFSNATGDLYWNSEHLITEEDLPDNLQRAWYELWTDSTGSLCYLTRFQMEDGIALLNEFDSETAENKGVSMEDLYPMVVNKAKELSKDPFFIAANAKIIVTKGIGFEECHEIYVFLPWDTPKDIFEAITKHIDKNIYNI